MLKITLFTVLIISLLACGSEKDQNSSSIDANPITTTTIPQTGGGSGGTDQGGNNQGGNNEEPSEECKQSFIGNLQTTIANICSICHDGGAGSQFFEVKENDNEFNFNSFYKEFKIDYNKDTTAMLAFLTSNNHTGRNTVNQNVKNAIISFGNACQ